MSDDARLAALEAEVRRLSDQLRGLSERDAIADVLRRYIRGLDRHDAELESSAFWPDAQVNYGYYSGLRDDFVQWGNDGHEQRYAGHEHHITNQIIDIDGDVAHVESYVIYLLRFKDETATHIGGARYIDRMERRDGQWRISVREFLPDIMMEAKSIFAGEFAEAMLPRSGPGRWDRSDLSYRRPLKPRSSADTGA